MSRVQSYGTRGDGRYDIDSVSLRILSGFVVVSILILFFFQAEDGIRYLVRSRGLGDVYKRQASGYSAVQELLALPVPPTAIFCANDSMAIGGLCACLLYTSDRCRRAI